MKNASASQVRTWATEQGITIGKRGRIKEAVYGPFNKANKGKMQYVPESDAEKRHITVPGVVGLDKAGRKVTKSVTIPASDARVLVGVPTNQKGRISYATVALALSAQNAATVADSFTKEA